jgi:hypothetical protein
MDDDYFSLSSILADSHVSPSACLHPPANELIWPEQKLSCTFTLDVEGLGYLESGTENNVSFRLEYDSKRDERRRAELGRSTSTPKSSSPSGWPRPSLSSKRINLFLHNSRSWRVRL